MKRVLLAFALCLAGCASRDEIEARRRYETQEERSHRRVFYSGWLFPQVSEEDKDFYYRSWLRR